MTLISSLIEHFEFPKEKYFEQLFKKEQLQTLFYKFKTHSVDITEEEREQISNIVGVKLDYVSRAVFAHTLFYNFTDKDVWDGKTIDAKTIKTRLVKLQFENAPDQPFFIINVEKHYGEPTWDGREMHYNYSILKDHYFVFLDDLKKTFQTIKEDAFCITIENTHKKVQEGCCSYFVYKHYGEQIEAEINR